MIFSINLEIDLTDVEIKWLKDKFLPNRRSYNVVFDGLQGGLYRTNSVVKTLSEKNLIIVDSLSNVNLTQIGHKILDQFDRDKKITDILDGE